MYKSTGGARQEVAEEGRGQGNEGAQLAAMGPRQAALYGLSTCITTGGSQGGGRG